MLASLRQCLRRKSAIHTPVSLLQNPDDLLFRKATTLHALVLAWGQNQLQTGLSPRGKVNLSAVPTRLAKSRYTESSVNRAHKELEWGRGGSEEDSHKHQRVATEYTRQTDIDHEGAYDQDEPR